MVGADTWVNALAACSTNNPFSRGQSRLKQSVECAVAAARDALVVRADREVKIVMSSTIIAADHTVVERSFREWQAEHTQLEAQLAESFAALDAYQSNLDNWQRELAAEREELQQLRATIERDPAIDENHREQLEQLSNELSEARQKISSLTAALLERTEELRDLDHQRSEAEGELSHARTREQELAASLTAQQQGAEAQRLQWEQEISRLREEAEKAAVLAASGSHGEPGQNSEARSQTRSPGSAVLGSVMEQFGKLRQQRSMNRLNPKPR